MGYTTDFWGEFDIDKPLDDETYELLIGLNETRRVARDVGPEFGTEGEFYVKGTGFKGQGEDSSIIDNNKPPSTQPGLWCQWRPTEDRTYIEWDGDEKFYQYEEWLEYLIEKILKPRGYSLTGRISWQGEETDDMGTLDVLDNEIRVDRGKVVYIRDSQEGHIKYNIINSLHSINDLNDLIALQGLIDNFKNNGFRDVTYDIVRMKEVCNIIAILKSVEDRDKVQKAVSSALSILKEMS